ncbi:hypothetical protein AAFF_G00383210 [Aldrovandia affinis]|uniref:Alpha-1,3-mannosyl-glycoprotein 4-beta-N-acetylglucosaminyltransferase C-like n=1 Tax=Aldrovandia affinis TaxID=143900 RepID=A0AAD7T8C0_9TELE|nr:hypothetical protein AAFF_G00383210 [Aldrovandia affinis]
MVLTCPERCRLLIQFSRCRSSRILFLGIMWVCCTAPFLFLFLSNSNSHNGCRICSFSERGTAEDTPHSSTPSTVPLNRTFSYHEDIAGPLRIPYQILAGERPRLIKYMSIGISSVKRKKENYLLGTLRSHFTQSNPLEVEDMILVVYLADWDPEVRKQMVQEVSDQFGEHLAAGHLVLITSPQTAYPTLEGLKHNYGDSEDRVRYRSKQNVDYAFLSNFCSGLARYHLVLEDDVHCSRNFLQTIRRKVDVYPKLWTTMAFSKLGYIGKLYHSADLPTLARFLLMFYDEMPCDWLLDHFFHSKAQVELVQMKPSLFQHVGSYSSFKGGHNQLKDNEFQEVVEPSADNPLAMLFTDMKAYQQNTLDTVYKGMGFFWGMGVLNGSHVSVHFKEPVALKGVQIVTGSPEHSGDILRRGLAEVGWRGSQKSNLDDCHMFLRIGDFINGTLEIEGLDLGAKQAVDCLRVRVTGNQREWLLLSKLNVWTVTAGNATILSTNRPQNEHSVE